MLPTSDNDRLQPKKMSRRFMSNLSSQDPQMEKRISSKTMMLITIQSQAYLLTNL